MTGKIQRTSFRGREDKLTMAGTLLRGYLFGRVLDVGCDQGHLRDVVGEGYVGIDIGGRPNVFADLECGLPLRDRSFDCVVGFDVLEHVDNLHFLFDEMCRVSRLHVIVGLPNAYEWRFRAAMLCGKKLSGKYGLLPERPSDRHRWIFNLEDAVRFVQQRGGRKGYHLTAQVLGYYRYHNVLGKLVGQIGAMMGNRGINFFAYQYWAVLRRL
jgi:SAM-dependent methyltransferase